MIASKVDELFKSVKTLPTLPPVVQKVLASINDPKVGAKQLAEIITSDQAITTRVLKLVNSSFFGLRGKVSNIHHAVTLLGFSTIRQILLGVSICKNFKGLNVLDKFSGESFWMHSIATAILARNLSKIGTKVEPDIAYTVGLIHDIGKLLLLQHHEEQYIKALLKAKGDNKPLYEAEKDVFEVDHTDVGNWLLKKWGLPRETRRALKNHHTAVVDKITPVSEDALTAVVFFANNVAKRFEIGNGGDEIVEMDDANFKTFFGINMEETNLDAVKLREEVEIYLEILGIMEPAAL